MPLERVGRMIAHREITHALVVAAFQHAYIWVHMLCTEGPDMRRMYGPV